MAFALSVFIGAANRSVLPARDRPIECKWLFLELTAGKSLTHTGPNSALASLPEAFAILWQTYQDDGRLYSICARVLGFCFYMERTGGEELRPWYRESAGDSSTIVLDGAVIEALGAVNLSADGRIPEAEFLRSVQTVALRQ